jgi:RNA polymerase sigma factor (sigma-70 family)
MDQHDALAERFEAHRPRLRAVAYQTLGSASEADDAVQETWLRLSRSDSGTIENLGGWLTTVVARVCLNMLQARREEPVGMHLPETADGIDPETEALLADSIGPALLVILHTLAPAERLAFVLHDMFAVPFDEIAPIVGRSPAAARQLASRARRRVQGVAPVRGAAAVAARAITASRFAQVSLPALINGAVGVIQAAEGRPLSLMAFTITGAKIAAIDLTDDPGRIARADLAILGR